MSKDRWRVTIEGEDGDDEANGSRNITSRTMSTLSGAIFEAVRSHGPCIVDTSLEVIADLVRDTFNSDELSHLKEADTDLARAARKLMNANAAVLELLAKINAKSRAEGDRLLQEIGERRLAR